MCERILWGKGISMLIIMMAMGMLACQKNAVENAPSGGMPNLYRDVLDRHANSQAEGSDGQKYWRAVEKEVDWENGHRQEVEGLELNSFDVSNKGIKFTGKVNASRRIVFFRNKKGQTDFRIFELFGRANAQSFSEAIKEVFSFDGNKNLGEINGVVYNRNYLPLRSVNHARPMQVEKRVVAQTKAASGAGGGLATSMNSGSCQEWGAYLVTRDQFGNIIEEELLYTYFVGSCGTSNTEDQQAPDYGGGPSGPNYMEMLEEYAASESGNGEYSVMAPQDDEENQGFFTWTVTSGGLGSWSIKADTEFSFKRYPFRNLNMTPVFEYHISKYTTTKSFFVGSNAAIKSTWTQQTVKDWILHNGTDKAQGQSVVSGTVEHKLNITIPYLSEPSITTTRSGSCFFNPR